jgi:hypothetical protein
VRERLEQQAADDDLWSRMADAAAAGPLTTEQVDMLSEATESALPLLLSQFGYRCPPPPPAGELVDDTVAALAAALTADVDRPAMVKQARWHFLTMSMRIRRQLGQAPPIAHTSVLRGCARRVGSTARVLVPAVVAAGSKAFVETAAKDLGPVASQMLGHWSRTGSSWRPRRSPAGGATARRTRRNRSHRNRSTRRIL